MEICVVKTFDFEKHYRFEDLYFKTKEIAENYVRE